MEKHPTSLLKRKSTYTLWEFYYFDHLRNLAEIFVRELEESCPELKTFLQTKKFFLRFCQFIYQFSSGYISQFEDLPKRKFYFNLWKTEN
jgi:hypothetical protein